MKKSEDLNRSQGLLSSPLNRAVLFLLVACLISLLHSASACISAGDPYVEEIPGGTSFDDIDYVELVTQQDTMVD